MALTLTSVSNAAGESAGNTTTAGTAAVTPTIPAGMVNGRSRCFVVQCHSGVAGTTPTGWTALFKDVVIGSGAVAAGSGQRYMSAYWRDKDATWAVMPAFTLTSSTQLSHWVGAVAVTKDDESGGNMFTLDAPTYTTAGSDFGTANTAHSATTGSLTTHTNGLLIIASVTNDNVTSTTPGLTQSGATFGTVTERCDGGIATGNDVSGKIHTCPVTTGATATLTHTQTLSAASEGGTIVIEQTQTSSAAAGMLHVDSGITNAASVTIPAHLVGDRILITAWAAAATPPAAGPTYTSIATASSATVSSRIGYRVADGTAADDSGTWTGAAVCTVAVYRRVGNPGAAASNVGTSASIDYPGYTSTVAGSMAYRSAATLAANTVPTAPLTGFVFRAGQTNVGSFDSNGPLANPAAGSQAVDLSEAWNAFTVEIPPAGSAALTGAGTSTTAATITGSGVVGVTGSGSVTATATIAGAGTAGTVGFTGAGSSTAAAAIVGAGATSSAGTLTAAAAITGAGVLGRTGGGTQSIAATVTGSGAVAVTGAGSRTATATITGAGTAAAVGAGTVTTTATIAGTGRASGAGTSTTAAAITGAGVLATTGSGSLTVAATIAGSAGTLILGTGTLTATATIAGAGTAAATGAGTRPVTATITGAGTAAATGTGTATTAATITGSGVVGVTGSGTRTVTATIAGSFGVGLSGSGTRAVSAAITGAGVLGSVPVGGTFTAITVITGSGIVGRKGNGAILVVASITGSSGGPPLPQPGRIASVWAETRTAAAAAESRTVTSWLRNIEADAGAENRVAAVNCENRESLL